MFFNKVLFDVDIRNHIVVITFTNESIKYTCDTLNEKYVQAKEKIKEGCPSLYNRIIDIEHGDLTSLNRDEVSDIGILLYALRTYYPSVRDFADIFCERIYKVIIEFEKLANV
jgi:hypothetical protein